MSGSGSAEERSHESDVEWCHDAVQDVSRTFALTVQLLREPMRTEICVGYLLCRVPDTIEDADHIPAGEQAALLDEYASVVDGEISASEFVAAASEWIPEDVEERDDEADWRTVERAERIFGAYRTLPDDTQAAMDEWVGEMVSGMSEFVTRYADEGGLRLRSWTELDSYCYYVAGTVGHMITDLVSLADDVDEETEAELRFQAEAFGRLLQLTNIAKDVPGDFEEENNVYLPASELRDRGVEPDAVTAVENEEAVAEVIEEVVSRARSQLTASREYLQAMPTVRGNTLAAWAVPYLLAVGTLRELDSRAVEVAAGDRVTVERSEVERVLAEAASMGVADLDDLEAAVSAGEFA